MRARHHSMACPPRCAHMLVSRFLVGGPGHHHRVRWRDERTIAVPVPHSQPRHADPEATRPESCLPLIETPDPGSNNHREPRDLYDQARTPTCSRMLSPVRVNAGSPVAVDHDLSVAASLEVIESGTVTPIGDLYDRLGEEVWTVNFIITDDVAAAQRATIGSFVQALRTLGVVPATLPPLGAGCSELPAESPTASPQRECGVVRQVPSRTSSRAVGVRVLSIPSKSFPHHQAPLSRRFESPMKQPTTD